jgi:hypothetical protein
MSSSSPKTAFFAKYVASGATTVVGVEDASYWKGVPGIVNLNEPKDIPSGEVIMLNEVLQKVDDPVALLKECASKAPKLLITVPNEWNWPAQYEPMKNKTHVRFYDSDLLAEHLDAAGLVWLMGSIEYAGWSFLSVEASKA